MNDNIMFTDDVMNFLRYTAKSSFNEFLRKKEHKFPKPFKIGRRNVWHREDVENWLAQQRANAAQ